MKSLFIFCLSILPVAVYAAPDASATSGKTRQELNSVRQEIKTVQSDIAQKEAARKAAQSAISESEQTLSTTRRELSTLSQQRQQSEQKLAELSAHITQTQQQIHSTRARVSAMLNSQYLRGQHDAMALLLNSGDPNQRARDLVYYQHIARAQTSLIGQLRQQQTQLESLSVQLEAELQRLNKLTGRKVTEKTQLESIKASQQVASTQLSSQIHTQQQKLAELKASEQRMSSLLVQIQRQAEAQRLAAAKQRKAKQEAAREAARKENERRRKVAAEAKKAGKPVPDDVKEPVKVETVDVVADDSASGQAFRKLQGRMKLPVAGQLTGRFGGKREEGSTWKGVFISASPGQAVRSVADGRVAYANYLRGFGNTIVVDHGGNYLTVYTGLSSFGRSSGSSVRAGETLGSSGALESGETGLYFEIRYMGRPVNPMSWAH